MCDQNGIGIVARTQNWIIHVHIMNSFWKQGIPIT